jgi:hypothetical protein
MDRVDTLFLFWRGRVDTLNMQEIIFYRLEDNYDRIPLFSWN